MCVSVNEADVDKWRVSPRETRAQAIFRALGATADREASRGHKGGKKKENDVDDEYDDDDDAPPRRLHGLAKSSAACRPGN